jgi:stress responsive alpha/beta barrel protein
MPNEIDGVQRITVGRNRAESQHGFTHALIVQLAALAHYLDHPARKRYLTEHLDPIVDQRIDIDVPVDLALEREPLASWYWGLGVGMGALPADD